MTLRQDLIEDRFKGAAAPDQGGQSSFMTQAQQNYDEQAASEQDGTDPAEMIREGTASTRMIAVLAALMVLVLTAITAFWIVGTTHGLPANDVQPPEHASKKRGAEYPL